ncbi:MAG: hypothetical protein KatS3mg109_0783 [Pirellulaceae bacterium]|nr:MAG: hypothetical protein KatS3mg109_0783 [Pirellulaceae bacterium]
MANTVEGAIRKAKKHPAAIRDGAFTVVFDFVNLKYDWFPASRGVPRGYSVYDRYRRNAAGKWEKVEEQ